MVKEEGKKSGEKESIFENRHPGIKIAFKIGFQTPIEPNVNKQMNVNKNYKLRKKLQFIISKNLDATLSVTGTLAPFSENYDSYNLNCKKNFERTKLQNTAPCLLCNIVFIFFRINLA